MIEITVSHREEGFRLDRLLQKMLPAASKGFIYKMLRKKNITLNAGKAGGDEKVLAGDIIRFYFSEETYRKFAAGAADDDRKNKSLLARETALIDDFPNWILYEDDEFLFLSKPAGILSQKASPDDLTVSELTALYVRNNAPEGGAGSVYRAGICNRLDRNTSGIIAAGKTAPAARLLNEMIAKRSVRKFYYCFVKGEVEEAVSLKGFLLKNHRTNEVAVFAEKPESGAGEADAIETVIRPLRVLPSCTLLEVELITGKTHQIRAHLAGTGHPLLGDPKYGDPRLNAVIRKSLSVKRQLLHACRMEFPDEAGCGSLRGKTVRAPLPEDFKNCFRQWGIEYDNLENQGTARIHAGGSDQPVQ